jgi:NADPH:quinone reductase-like Zn-dependent oxidoreductase
MKAAVVNVLGEAPKYQSFFKPEAADGEVLINVRTAGLHPIVKGRASATHHSSDGVVPMVPGLDGVGTLEDGRRVYFGSARAPFGTMSEWAVAPRRMTFPVPDGIDDVQAAAIVNPGMSAWIALKERGGLAAGETVLILGATGVAGQLAVQVARHLGAKRVIGAGRNVVALASADLDQVIALEQPEDAVRDEFAAEAPKGIDLVIDYLWGRPTELLLEALAKGVKASATPSTRLVEVGASAGPNITLPAAILRSVDLKMQGSGFGAARMDVIFAAIPILFSLAAEGKLKVDAEPVPLAEVESAWNRVSNGKRIVFVV